jgi:16S rRNA (cytosine967-C5)-methyltransferase
MRSYAGEGSGGTGATLVRGEVTDARLAAANILADLRRGELLDAAFERHVAALDARDRRWLQELIYGLLRRRETLDAELRPRVRGGLARLDADLLDLLRLGVYQLLHMGSVPSYAAIGQSVELAKVRHGIGASRLANAVLRRIDRERGEAVDAGARAADPVEALALRSSHPAWLVRRWVEQWGMEGADRLLARNNEEAPLIIRPFHVVREQLETALEQSGVRVEDVPLVADSLRISGAGSLPELSAYRQGLFFMQDPAATLVTRYAAFPPGGLVVDLAAAPGGKTFELARTASFVVAADRSIPRLHRMAANMTRLDTGNIALVAMDVRVPAVAGLRTALLDVPCTGTGTFRRHPDARWRLKPSDLAVLTALQREMLLAAADAVAPGGLLVYSTCSLELEENDERVDDFLRSHPDWTLEPPPDGSVPGEVLDAGRLRVLPHVHGVDGAFAARLRRNAS